MRVRVIQNVLTLAVCIPVVIVILLLVLGTITPRAASGMLLGIAFGFSALVTLGIAVLTGLLGLFLMRSLRRQC